MEQTNNVNKKTKKVTKEKKPKTDIIKIDNTIISDLVLKGDMRQFAPDQKVKYYNALCQSLNLNPLTRPFDLIVLNNRETLYANKSCAEQLRKLNKISIVEMTKNRNGNIYEVTVKAVDGEGRYEISTGAISIDGLGSAEIAIAIMKAETKAKRRVTLALSGLGMADESELDHIDYPTAEIIDERKKKEQEAIEKLESLSEDIKEGFKLLGYNAKAAWIFCEKFGWEENRIKQQINIIFDSKKPC
jgi:hypothetical protein